MLEILASEKLLLMGWQWDWCGLLCFGAYALGFWYGAKLTRDESDIYTIGNVMIVSTCCFLKQVSQICKLSF